MKLLSARPNRFAKGAPAPFSCMPSLSSFLDPVSDEKNELNYVIIYDNIINNNTMEVIHLKSMAIQDLGNPVRSKVLIEISMRGPLSAKELLQIFPDITQPTLYRHLRAMVKDNLLTVAKETPIRGTVEKSYTLSPALNTDAQKIITENDGPGYMSLFNAYILGILGEFQHYTRQESIDILKDGSGFTVAPVYVTLSELQNALIGIGKIIGPLLANQPTPERKLHNLCVITTPPSTTEKR